MILHDYTRNQFNNCVYSKEFSPYSYIYLLLYVDYMLIVAKDMTRINNLKATMKNEFKMKDLGAAKKILGMEIQRDKIEGRLCISQQKYIEKVL